MASCSRCCGSSAEAEDLLHLRGNPGPKVDRHCTDPICCLLFLVVFGATGVLLSVLWQVGDVRRINHGRDHDGNLCGLKEMEKKPFLFYPDLDTDFKNDPTLSGRYGVCVSECAQEGQVVEDYGHARQTSWLVLQPSFPVFQRCLPFQKPTVKASTKLCVKPACEVTSGVPFKPEQVCGLQRDGTDKYWLLEKPDSSITDGWRAEGASDVLIQSRVSMASSAWPSNTTCQQRVKREAEVSVKPLDDSVANILFTSVTSPAYSFGNAVSENLGLVLGLGVGGAALLSVAIMLMFPVCAPPLLVVLLLVVFLMLIAADYILFVQANIATGRTGARFTNFLKSLDISVPAGAEDLLQHSSDQSTTQLFALGAFALALVIAVLACLVMSMSRQFKILIALLEEAGNMIRRVPSLLALPLLLLASFAVFFSLFFVASVGLATASQDQLQASLEKFNLPTGVEDVKHFQQISAVCLILVFLWIYFFHIALYHTTIALTVSNSYFQGDLAEHHLCPSVGGCFGAPMVVSLGNIFRYHLGSLAFGSFALMLCTVARVVFEYVERHTKEATDQNLLAKTIRCVTKCCINMLYGCLRYLTQYAYIYIAVIGEAFVPSCCKSFQLFAKYPAQVALNTLTTWALGFLVSLGVPLALAGLAFFELRDSLVTYQACAIALMILAFIVSHMAVGVYDVIVTTLLICAMRDEELCGAQFMSDSLSHAAGFGRHRHQQVECS